MLPRHLGRWNWQRVGVSQKITINGEKNPLACLACVAGQTKLVSAVVFWRQSLVKIGSKQDGGCDQCMYLEEEGEDRWKQTRPTYGTALTFFGPFRDPNDWFSSPFIYFNWQNPLPLSGALSLLFYPVARVPWRVWSQIMLRPKGVPILGFRYMKGQGFHQLTYMKGEGNLSFGSLYSPLDGVAPTRGFDYMEWMPYVTSP